MSMNSWICFCVILFHFQELRRISLQYFPELKINIILRKKVLDSISVAFSDIVKSNSGIFVYVYNNIFEIDTNPLLLWEGYSDAKIKGMNDQNQNCFLSFVKFCACTVCTQIHCVA